MLVLRILRTTSFDLFTPSRLGCGRYHMYFLALFSDQLWTYCLQSTENQAQNASLWQGIGIQIENGRRQSCIKLFKEHGRRVSQNFWTEIISCCGMIKLNIDQRDHWLTADCRG